MKVSDATKLAYKETSVHKNLRIYFPSLNLTIPHSQIYAESMTLKESIFDGSSIEFVGCISSEFSIQIYGVDLDLEGQQIEVGISTDDTEEIPLFHGTVYSAVKQSNKYYKKITAYDSLYTSGNTEVSAWYNSLTFPITLKNIRDSLFAYLGIEQVATVLPNDNVSISKQYEPKSLKALNVMKAICQINGAFGIINRNNLFEYRILASDIVTSDIPYPSNITFPAITLFPANPSIATAVFNDISEEVEAETFSFYKKVDYEEYEVKPVDKITIRQSENDTGITYGSGTNNYIIQGNMFTYGLDEITLSDIAQNVYNNVKGISYHPFTSENNGLPFIECGLDAVSYYMIDYGSKARSTDDSSLETFYVFSRELSGIQSLNDSYSGNGEKYQTEFITDLQTQIDVIKQDVKQEVEQTISDYTYDKSYLDSQFASISQLNVVSVAELPEVIDENTIYLIQGEVTVT